MERVMQTLTREVPRFGFETEVAIPRQPNSRPLEEWFGYHGARVLLSDELAQVSAKSIRAALPLANYLRTRGADVLNVHSPGAHLPLVELLAGRLAGLPVVVSIHGYDASGAVSPREQLRNRLIGGPTAAAVVPTNITGMRQQIARGVPPAKLELIYNAVPEPARLVSRDEARRQLGLDPDLFVSVTFARLVPDKGIDVLIQAIQLLPDELLRRSRVLIGGTGVELPRLRRQMTDRVANVVRFLGHVQDPSTYYDAADVLVAPSRHEPFGLVFLEAGHHALPSIGTRVGGIPEVVTDGETGLLVEPEDPRQLAETILTLSRDARLRAKLGAAGRERVRTSYTLDSMVSSYAALYGRTLRRPEVAAAPGPSIEDTAHGVRP
jgi:glycosyltransferase involved in cell wall biosynthesis